MGRKPLAEHSAKCFSAALDVKSIGKALKIFIHELTKRKFLNKRSNVPIAVNYRQGHHNVLTFAD